MFFKRIARRNRMAEAAVGNEATRDQYTAPADLGPSKLARRLSRRYRLARLNPTKAGVLSSPEHKKLVYRWFLRQIMAARAALASVQEIPGIRVDPYLAYAVDLTLQKRVEVYAATPFFFEECEVLTRAIANYASALRSQHEARCHLRRAEIRLSEARNELAPARSSILTRAQGSVRQARSALDPAARRANDRLIAEAQLRMREAAALVEDKFKLTTMLPEYMELPSDGLEELGDATRKSDSCRRELRPAQRPRV